jgi:NADPH2:quinone reductase
MKAIVFDNIGPPQEVLQFREVPIPEIKDNEVLVRMVSASINPGDFLFIQNLYPEPKKPRLPQQIAGTGGGAGIVTAVGKGVPLKPGTLVAFSYYNAWAEYAAVPAEWLMPLPAAYPLEKAAQFANFISAWDLLSASGVQSGQWLALTAGNSTMATLVLQLARRRNVNVVCIVRRAEKNRNPRALGAAAVIELSGLSEGVGERVMQLTQNKGVNAVIDCVGGLLAGELIRSMALGGQMIVYGGFSAEKFELHNFDILMKVMEIKSYAYRYFFDPPKKEDMTLLEQIAEASGRPDFSIPVGGIHRLEDFKSAVDETLNHPERGKHFFRISGADEFSQMSEGRAK